MLDMEFPLTLEQVQALEPKVAKCLADENSWWPEVHQWLTPAPNRGIMDRCAGPYDLPTVAEMVKINFLAEWSSVYYLPAYLRATRVSMEDGEHVVWDVATKFMPFMEGSDPLEHWDELNRTQKEIIHEWLEWSLRPVKTDFIDFAEIYPGMVEDDDRNDFYAPASFNDLFQAEREINRYRAWLAIWKEKLDEEALQDAKRIPGSS